MGVAMKNNFHKKLQLLKPHERLEIKTYNDISHIYNFEKETDVKLNYHFDDAEKLEVSYHDRTEH